MFALQACPGHQKEVTALHPAALNKRLPRQVQVVLGNVRDKEHSGIMLLTLFFGS